MTPWNNTGSGYTWHDARSRSGAICSPAGSSRVAFTWYWSGAHETFRRSPASRWNVIRAVWPGAVVPAVTGVPSSAAATGTSAGTLYTRTLTGVEVLYLLSTITVYRPEAVTVHVSNRVRYGIGQPYETRSRSSKSYRRQSVTPV